jgi:hypothetical protein
LAASCPAANISCIFRTISTKVKDTKGVIRSGQTAQWPKEKKNIKNPTKKKNNDLQNTTEKIKDQITISLHKDYNYYQMDGYFA